ncbi:hypothetical protein [Azospirillum sp. A39]|uniref:hypothetical protein n=1 Tax=Azospirillum sp. A39 TaxID=3462279 RepID=UPI004046174C
MARALSPHLARTLAAVRQLRDRAREGGKARQTLTDVEALLVAAGDWGAMVRETGAGPETLTREEWTLVRLLGGERC